MDTSRWTKTIDQVTHDFKASFGALNERELNWKPTPTAWSIAQNIDHLIVINTTYFPLLMKLREGKLDIPWIGKINFMVNWFGKVILKSVQPDRKKKMKTFPLWEPSQSALPIDILLRFEKHQSELKTMIESCRELLDAHAVMLSPANKNIVYKLETAFDIITTHERRHFEQAKEVLNLLPRN